LKYEFIEYAKQQQSWTQTHKFSDGTSVVDAIQEEGNIIKNVVDALMSMRGKGLNRMDKVPQYDTDLMRPHDYLTPENKNYLNVKFFVWTGGLKLLNNTGDYNTILKDTTRETFQYIESHHRGSTDDITSQIHDLRCYCEQLKVIEFLSNYLICTHRNQEFLTHYSPTRSKKDRVAVIAVTDLHCNEQNYTKIKNTVEQQLALSNIVVLVINGDIVHKRNIINKERLGENRVIVHASSGDTHKQRLKNLLGSFCSLRENQDFYLVCIVGNHEVATIHKYKESIVPDVADFYFYCKQSFGTRFAALSDLEISKPYESYSGHRSKHGLVGLVDRTFRLRNLLFAGHTTYDVFTKDFSFYQMTKQQGFIKTKNGDDYQTILEAIKQKTSDRSRDILIFGSHASSHETSKIQYNDRSNVLSEFKNSVCILGHDHDEYLGGAIRTQHSNSKHNINIFRITLAPKPLGCSAVMIYAYPDGSVETAPEQNYL
jgi:hypothetical protein